MMGFSSRSMVGVRRFGRERGVFLLVMMIRRSVAAAPVVNRAEKGQAALQFFGLRRQLLRDGIQIFGRDRVLLRDLIQLLHGGIDLLRPQTLLAARGRNFLD